MPKKLAQGRAHPAAARNRSPRAGGFLDRHRQDVGEWAGYILLALVVIVLLRRIPVPLLRWNFRLFPLVFIAGTLHGLMLMPAGYWLQPWLAHRLHGHPGRGTGGDGAHWRIGVPADQGNGRGRHPTPDGCWRSPARPARGRAISPASACWRISARRRRAPILHRGQRLEPADGRSSSPSSPGDHTRSLLPGRVAVGQTIRLEGPYGGFTFNAAPRRRQPGVGGRRHRRHAPFIARLQEPPPRAAMGAGDFFYSTADAGRAFQQTCWPPVRRRRCACTATTPALHGPLPADEVAARVKPGRTVWFCGPAAWGESPADHLPPRPGPKPAGFHQASFDFR